jgi:hypothetical protein
MKKIITFLFLFIFSFSPAIAGNNITMTCNSSDCSKSTDLPLFNETNAAPGNVFSQTVSVVNNRAANCNLLFKLNSNLETDLLSSALTVSLVSGPTVWYSGLLSNLFDGQNHQLGSIPNNSTKDFLWTVSFNQEAGNEYQSASNLFDLDFNFTCDDEPTTTTTSITSTSTGCSDSVPSGIPQNLTAIAGTNSVTLNWTEPSGDFTYYLIAFGTTPSADTYGNPNIGGKGTTSYTVGSLSAGQTYYFKIRVGNGCVPGQFSTIISATPGGRVFIIPEIPAGFQENVLGIQETVAPIIEEPSILGEQLSVCQKRFFPWIALLVFLLNLILAKKKIITFLLTALLLIVDYLILKNNCPWLWAYDLSTFIVPRILAIIFL